MLKFAYLEGIWKGFCETCLSSAEKTYLNTGQPQTLCRRGKCPLCRKKGGIYYNHNLVSFDESALKWGKQLFDHYKGIARPITRV
jgi:hypothetical protein